MIWTKEFEFFDIEELIADQGDVAIIIEDCRIPQDSFSLVLIMHLNQISFQTWTLSLLTFPLAIHQSQNQTFFKLLFYICQMTPL